MPPLRSFGLRCYLSAVGSKTGGLPALRSRDYRRLLIGQFLSLTGTQMQHVAMVWQLYLFTRSPLSLGLLGLFRVAPVIAFAVGGGGVADALDRRRLLLVSQSLLAAISLTFAIFTYQGWANAYTTYALAFLAGAATAVDSPTPPALVPLLIPREHLANALSLHTMAWQVASVLGPPLAGWMLGSAGLVAIYLVDAVSFLAVIGALWTIHDREPARPK